MEALTFMKSWLSNPNGKPRREIRISESTNTALNDSKFDLYEGDDSFFELEISTSDFSLKHNNKNPQENQTAPFSVSKSKILPFVDIVSRPHSPITLLKSGPKFRAFSFKKSKPIESEKSTTETLTLTKKESSRSLNVRFKIEDGNSNENSSFRKTASIARLEQTDDTVFDDSASPASSTSSSASSSKRFFSLIKPFYTKTSKKQSSFNSASNSPLKHRNSIPSGIRSVRRQLGKSRSASATVGVMSPAKRIDESLQVQQDGIQSAILHCKKSFHGSSESSLLSRSTSESSSQEKLSTSSSEDSYLFSRIASDSMSSEKSMDNSLTSIKEQREKITE